MPAGHPDGSTHGIRLSDGTELPGPDYDDWDCLDDLERQGYVENVGTGTTPACKITEAGRALSARLRDHKAQGGRLATFRPFTS